jgi:hypothetical protein
LNSSEVRRAATILRGTKEQLWETHLEKEKLERERLKARIVSVY